MQTNFKQYSSYLYQDTLFVTEKLNFGYQPHSIPQAQKHPGQYTVKLYNIK